MLKTLIADEFRLLTFRPAGPAVHTHWKAFLAFGFFFTWLAGVGRYWDNPKADVWQWLGLGSLAYVFVLALIVWAFLAPLRPKNWSYRNVLLFITLTAPPAIIYAIPVEKFMLASSARTSNGGFLVVVASWRVAMFALFLRRVAGLSRGMVVVATLLPLAMIVGALSALNLEHVVVAVFNVMGGIREDDRSANDTAFGIVLLLALLSWLASPFLLAAYVAAIWRTWRGARRPAAPTGVPDSRKHGEDNP